MRVVIVSSFLPFVKGGGSKIVDDLFSELQNRSIPVERLMLPLLPDWETLPDQTLAFRLLDLAGTTPADRIICIRFPAHAVRHPNKVSWFIHHFREAYDLWDTPLCPIPHNEQGQRYRQQLHASDTMFLKECRSIFTNSKIIQDRLKRFNDLDADAVLYPPLPTDHGFHPGDFGDYFFYPSRVCDIKRQWLAIEAMVHVDPSMELVIGGTSETPEYLHRLEQQVNELGLQDRVHFTGWISEAEKANWMANCSACLYLALDEDSYGYVTLEAYHAEKPVITLTDSGGALEIVEDGRNGSIAEPTPEALAEKMNQLARNRIRCYSLGREGRASIDRLGIDWNRVIERLVA